MAINSQKDKLFSVISHDLRGPVGRIDDLLSLMMDEKDILSSPEKFYEYAGMLKDSSSKTRELLEDLLIWSRNQFNKITFEPLQLPLQDYIQRVSRHLEPQAHGKNVALKIHIDPSEILVFADPNMLTTILRNLISNAIKFSYPNKEVIITAQKIENFQVQISIKDHGVGMDPQDQEKLFDKKTHFSTHGTKGEKGSGLGLDLCHDFVRKNNGKITVQSEPGKGSTFSFTLPLANPQENRITL